MKRNLQTFPTALSITLVLVMSSTGTAEHRDSMPIQDLRLASGAKQWMVDGEAERDRLLRGMFEIQPRWYAFFYLATRLGLRNGEVYAISRDRIQDVPPTLIVDRAVQCGYKDRPAMLGSRKNHEVYTTALGRDVIEAIRWHVDQGYAGPQFLFSPDGTFPKFLDGHKRPLRTVKKALGLPLLSHHQIGRHSMASQAATGGSGDQSHPSSTRAPLRPEHRGVRAPR